MTRHLNLFNPQWQGGGPDLSTYFGGMELKEFFLRDVPFSELPVDTAPISAAKHGIIGYDDLRCQLRAARELLEREQPETIFTIGGGCDADLMCMSYLAGSTEGLTVVYVDAHGDLNTPDESNTHLFYGMPGRTLLGEGDTEFVRMLPAAISPRQLIQIGGRSLDEGEQRYIETHDVVTFPPAQINTERLAKAIGAAGSRRLYVHIDLDVLDPAEFPYVPVPEADGLSQETLLSLLTFLTGQYNVCGIGLFEYNVTGRRLPLIQRIMELGLNLGAHGL